jgi:hypothetical protein
MCPAYHINVPFAGRAADHLDRLLHGSCLLAAASGQGPFRKHGDPCPFLGCLANSPHDAVAILFKSRLQRHLHQRHPKRLWSRSRLPRPQQRRQNHEEGGGRRIISLHLRGHSFAN